MLGKFLATVALAVIGLGVYLYFYLGFFLPVQVSTGERGPYFMVFKEHKGAYHQIGGAIRAVEDWAKEKNLRCELTFGEYMDDPAAVDQDRLRSRAGCLFPAKPSAEIPAEFGVFDLVKKSYAIGSFEGAPSIGPFKVYPKVQEFIQTQRLKQTGAVIETYQIRGEKVTTEFLFPLETSAQ